MCDHGRPRLRRARRAATSSSRPAPVRRAGRGPGPPAPRRHLRHRLPHLRGQASVPRSIRASWATNSPSRSSRRPPAPASRRRDLRRQPLPLLRQLHRLPRRQAQLLRARSPCSASTGTAAWPSCSSLPAGNLIRAAGPDVDACADRRVPRHRRPRGAPRPIVRGRAGAGRRRRAHRPRRRALRATLRRRSHRHGPRCRPPGRRDRRCRRHWRHPGVSGCRGPSSAPPSSSRSASIIFRYSAAKDAIAGSGEEVNAKSPFRNPVRSRGTRECASAFT